jgi:hypothetical protein
VKFRDGGTKNITFSDNLFVLSDENGNARTIDPDLIDLSGAKGAKFDGNAYWQIDGTTRKFLGSVLDSDADPTADGAASATPAGSKFASLTAFLASNPSSKPEETDTKIVPNPVKPRPVDVVSNAGSGTSEGDGGGLVAPHQAIPEPTTASLLGVGLAAALARRTRRRP